MLLTTPKCQRKGTESCGIYVCRKMYEQKYMAIFSFQCIFELLTMKGEQKACTLGSAFFALNVIILKAFERHVGCVVLCHYFNGHTDN